MVPAPPVAHMGPRVTQEQYSRLRALPTAEDVDKFFEANENDPEADANWRSKKK